MVRRQQCIYEIWLNMRLRYFTPSWRRAWTIATQFSRGRPGPSPTSFIKYWRDVKLQPTNQQVLNVTACVVSDTRMYDRGLSHLLDEEMHWLDVPQWVQFKLCSSVHRRLQSRASQHMTECCIPFSNITCWQHLRSAVRISSQAFDVPSWVLLCGWLDGLELVTWHCSWSDTFIWQFPRVT